jgi:hypothetical protein
MASEFHKKAISRITAKERASMVKTLEKTGKTKITEVKPPTTLRIRVGRFDIFLAGSIENGKAEEWQTEFIRALNKMSPKPSLCIFNPRRDNWDVSWNQHDNPQLIEQIEWELDHLDRADLIVMYLQPGTISPISLLELGLYAGEVSMQKKQMIVLCPEGFHRKGNVDVVCDRYGIAVAKDMKDLIKQTKQIIRDGI